MTMPVSTSVMALPHITHKHVICQTLNPAKEQEEVKIKGWLLLVYIRFFWYSIYSFLLKIFQECLLFRCQIFAIQALQLSPILRFSPLCSFLFHCYWTFQMCTLHQLIWFSEVYGLQDWILIFLLQCSYLEELPYINLGFHRNEALVTVSYSILLQWCFDFFLIEAMCLHHHLQVQVDVFLFHLQL